MNSAEIKQVSLAYNDLFKNTKKFEEFKKLLESKRENDSFDKEQLEKIVDEFKQRLEAIAKFERELDKFEKFISSGIFKNLKDSLTNEKSILGRIGADAAGYLELNDQMYLDSLINAFDSEKDISEVFNKEMDSFATDLGFNLLRQAMDEEISLEDLRLMAIAFESDSALHDRITHVIDVVEKRNAEKERQIEEAEKQVESEDEKTVEPVVEEKESIVTTTSEPVAETKLAPSLEPRKLTLEEKIAAINYQQGVNLNKEVQELTVESSLEQLTSQIQALQGKEKLTIKDIFQLRQLQEQCLALEAYEASLSEQKVTGREKRRNKKLSSNVDKIEKKETELQKAIEQSQNYSSKTLRFLSARYQGKLNEQLAELRTKQCTLTGKQKESSLARYDKKAKKLMRKAKRKGTIEQLKVYKESLVQELQNLGQDVSRFISTKSDDMEVLESSVIVSTGNIISFEEAKRNLEQQRLVA